MKKMSSCPQSTPVALPKCSRAALTQIDNQIESLVTKRKLNISKTETPEIEKKSKMAKFDTQENSIDIACPICFDDWTNSGPHRLVSLKCGHLFGESCIRIWLQQHSACTQCKQFSNLADIRIIFAKTLKSLDTNELEKERALNKELKKKYETLKNNMELFENGHSSILNADTLTVSLKESFGSSQLRQPTGICVSKDGLEIFVCNNYKHCISIFKTTGEFVANSGSKKFLFYPSKIAATQQGYVVVDRENIGYGWTGHERIGFVELSGIFMYRRLHSMDAIIEIEVNSTNEIVVLSSASSSTGLGNSLLFLSYEGVGNGVVKKQILLNESDNAQSFIIHEDKYILCAFMKIVFIDREGVVSLSIATSIMRPIGICRNSDGDLFLSEIFFNHLKISVYSSSGSLKRVDTYSEKEVRLASSLRMLPNGSLVTSVKKENSVFILDF